MSNSLKQSISVWQGIALYVGAVIGSGILILPGMTAGIAGADALFSWGGMILLSIPLAYTFAFLAREYPSAGGVSTFVEKAFGRYAGAIIGWFYFLAASAGQFIVPLTGGIYVTYVFHLPNLVAFIIAAILLASLAQVMLNTIDKSGAVVTAVIALVICLGTTNAFVASISRLAYSLAHTLPASRVAVWSFGAIIGGPGRALISAVFAAIFLWWKNSKGH